MRLDQFITLKKLAPSRSKAKELIESGAVSVRKPGGGWVIETSPSHNVPEDTEVRIEDPTLLKFVSRGGLKLEGALQDFQISVQGYRALDIGQSTGGFTDCLLQHGARNVLGIDVGRGQLHQKLTKDSRVQSVEGLHIDDIHKNSEVQSWLGEGLDLCVIDVSFISILRVFEAFQKFLDREYEILGLLKPQFEVGQKHLSKGGIVKDPKVVEKCIEDVKEELKRLGFQTLATSPSQIKGSDGNQEYWLYCRRESS